ncbi:hypothetical protein [Pantoea dispersa]|uniref:hypothetical protein n=1 Tax=Pantoea dispersa TaxID=59814 RepID=UPI0039B4EAC8
MFTEHATHFFGTLVISWLFYNWNKVAYFFLEDDKIINRISYVKHKIPDNSVILGLSIPHTHSVIFPFLWVTFISLTFPFFTYASIWIHRKITAHIETINTGKENSRIILQRGLMVEIAKNESAKALQLAKDDASIEQFREQAATSKANVEAVKVRKSSLEDEIKTMEAQHTALKTSLELTSENVDTAQKKLDESNKKHKEIPSKYSTFNELASSHASLENKINSLDLENQKK